MIFTVSTLTATRRGNFITSSFRPENGLGGNFAAAKYF